MDLQQLNTYRNSSINDGKKSLISALKFRYSAKPSQIM